MPETRTCKLLLGLNLDDCTDAARGYVSRVEASQLEVKDVEAYRKALDVSEADAAALWASRSVGPLAYREFWCLLALRRCASLHVIYWRRRWRAVAELDCYGAAL